MENCDNLLFHHLSMKRYFASGLSPFDENAIYYSSLVKQLTNAKEKDISKSSANETQSSRKQLIPALDFQS